MEVAHSTSEVEAAESLSNSCVYSQLLEGYHTKFIYGCLASRLTLVAGLITHPFAGSSRFDHQDMRLGASTLSLLVLDQVFIIVQLHHSGMVSRYEEIREK